MMKKAKLLPLFQELYIFDVVDFSNVLHKVGHRDYYFLREITCVT